MDKFKVGDRVYVPVLGNLIYQIDKYTCADAVPHTLLVENEYGDQAAFAENGHSRSGRGLPMVFHVTPENRAKLEAFYGEKFEKPPTKPTSRDIIQAMFERGDKYVCCWLSDGDETPDKSNVYDLIVEVTSKGFRPYREGYSWDYATPFDPATRQSITELPT